MSSGGIHISIYYILHFLHSEVLLQNVIDDNIPEPKLGSTSVGECTLKAKLSKLAIRPHSFDDFQTISVHDHCCVLNTLLSVLSYLSLVAE